MSRDSAASQAASDALDRLLADLGLDRQDTGGRIDFIGDDPIVASRHRPGAASAAALATQAVGIAAIWRQRGGRGQDIAIDLHRAAVPGLRTSSHLWQNGHRLEYGRSPEEARNFFRTRDGRRIYVLRTAAYAANLIGLLTLLGCANQSDALAAAIARWDSAELEEALAANRLIGAVARTREEWLAHPQGRWLATQAPVQVDKIADSAPEPFAPAPRPLSGIRVLDMAHVLAGPVCARVLAEQGADVLHVSEPLKPDDFRVVLDTGLGKRAAFIDLNRPDDNARVRALLATGDVFIQSFRPGSLDKRGLSALDVARLRPGIVYVSVSAYGNNGPWMTRGGFEPVGQTVSGLAIAEGSADAPVLAPTFTLNDYLAAYLAAAGVTAALARRARDGGSYHVHVSLARCSMWLQELGRLPADRWPDRTSPLLPEPRDSDFMTTDSVFGTLTHARPIVTYGETPARWDRGPSPLGASLPEWLAA
ncbi:MAG TPA: CoA transferase [Vineibacter sp.]|nr:CoA transferase [Vineibacter sp.]